MLTYKFGISIDDECNEEQKRFITEYLAYSLVNELKQKYAVDDAHFSVKTEGKKYYVYADNVKLIKEYVTCVKKQLQDIRFSMIITIDKVVSIKEQSDEEKCIDAIDWLSSKVKVDENIAGENPMVTEIFYVYNRNNIVYGVNVEILNLNQLHINVNVDVESDEDTQEIIELFDIITEECERICSTM